MYDIKIIAEIRLIAAAVIFCICMHRPVQRKYAAKAAHGSRSEQEKKSPLHDLKSERDSKWISINYYFMMRMKIFTP